MWEYLQNWFEKQNIKPNLVLGNYCETSIVEAESISYEYFTKFYFLFSMFIKIYYVTQNHVTCKCLVAVHSRSMCK